MREGTAVFYPFFTAASITAAIAASSSFTSAEEQDFETDSVTTDLFEANEPSSMTFRLQLVVQY